MAGRPTKYKKSFVDEAVQICQLGATMPELAAALGVSRRSIYQWANKHPAFSHAIKVGKGAADDRVERSLYQKAVGWMAIDTKRKYSISKAKNGREVRTLESEEIHEKAMAPDTVAGIFWLKNRRAAEWRDRHEYTGADGEPLIPADLTGKEACRLAAYFMQRDADAEELH